MTRLMTLLAATLLLASPAWADVAAPRPAECAPGGAPATDHYGGYCSAWACTADADCWSGQVCRPASLCVHDQLYEHPRGNTSRSQVVGQCPDGGACPEGAECRTASFCFQPAFAPAAAAESDVPNPVDDPKKKGRCQLAGDAAPGLLGLLLLVACRRRRPTG